MHHFPPLGWLDVLPSPRNDDPQSPSKDGDDDEMRLELPTTAPRRRFALLSERLLRGPYRRDSAMDPIFIATELSDEKVREESRRLATLCKPVASTATKVRGDIANTPHDVARNPQALDEMAMRSALLLVKHDGVDPDLLLSRPPGFPNAGLTTAKLKEHFHARALNEDRATLPSTMKDTVSSLSREAALQRLMEEDERARARETFAAFPALPPSNRRADREEERLLRRIEGFDDLEPPPNGDGVTDEEEHERHRPTRDGHWAVMDESPVDEFHAQIPQMAIRYPFELDAFQKRAVRRLERGESVFCAAHTSAGKTVVAEYAVALALEHRTRVVYTSPIKALSNQKYRDFCDKFGADKIGLLTGDNAVNPEASCVIMTTEILRSMLYRGADAVRDVEFVVFDEVHYISDPERGVIWEEVVIMLPRDVHVVMLSATTPNTLEFSSWVGRNRRERVYVVATERRPVPLEHFIYCANDLFKVMDSTGRFLPAGHAAAVKAAAGEDKHAEFRSASAQGGPRRDAPRKRVGPEAADAAFAAMVRDLRKRDLLPAICFAFSKKTVERRAEALGKLDFLDATQKSACKGVMARAIARLSAEDRTLPQISRVSALLARGVGVHHGGLLPLLKEVVEICFLRGLVKVLVATETFAMGVNAPCRAVVFEGGLRKHDGGGFRDLLPGEYTQMCGRAGRRGIDSVGTVIVRCNEEPPPLETLASVLSGKALSLSSQFRLRYAMMLSLIRSDALSVPEMMKRSFSEFARERLLGPVAARMRGLRDRAERSRSALEAFHCGRPECSPSGAKEADAASEAVSKTTQECVSEMLKGNVHGRRAKEEIMRPGRLVKITIPWKGTGEGDEETTIWLGFETLAVVLWTENEGSNERFEFGVVAALPPGVTPPPGATSLIWSQKEEEEELVMKPRQLNIKPGGAGAVNNKRGGGRGERAGLFDEDDDDMRSSKRKPLVISGSSAPVFFDRGATNAAVSPSPTSGPTPPLLFSTKPIGDCHFVVASRLSLASLDAIFNENMPEATSDVEGRRRDLLVHRSETYAKRLASILLSRFSEGGRPGTIKITPLDPLKTLHVDDMVLVERWRANELRRARLTTVYPVLSCPAVHTHRVLARGERGVEKALEEARLQLSDESLALFPDFEARLRVLRMLGYVDAEEADALLLKGRAACEIATCDELVLTELVFRNVFDGLDPAECVALLSALVLQRAGGGGGRDGESSNNTLGSEFMLPRRLETALAQCANLVGELAEAQERMGVRLDDGWIATTMNPELVPAVYEWARGRPFSWVAQLTSMEEGSIVRAITRLDETCREVRNIARIVGDPELLQKIERAAVAIKRDIIFATSLYVA